MLALLGMSGAILAWAAPGEAEGPTIVYLVRHAEKVNDGMRDPQLSEAGQQRAERLAHMLGEESIAAVYCTPTNRSRETGAPLAAAMGMGISDYAPMDANGLAGRIRELPQGKRVLIVAHSNTVPMILAALGGPEVPDLVEATEYDRLFVVILDDPQESSVLKLRF